MITYIQKGDNPKYPKEIVTWRYGEKVPEWISDNAKITFIDGLGNVTLLKRDFTSGGYEIVGADGISILISTKTYNSYICYDGKSKIFSLTEKQFGLLYEQKYRDVD